MKTCRRQVKCLDPSSAPPALYNGRKSRRRRARDRGAVGQMTTVNRPGFGEGLPRIGEGSLGRIPWRLDIPSDDDGVEPAREQPAVRAERQGNDPVPMPAELGTNLPRRHVQRRHRHATILGGGSPPESRGRSPASSRGREAGPPRGVEGQDAEAVGGNPTDFGGTTSNRAAPSRIRRPKVGRSQAFRRTSGATCHPAGMPPRSRRRR